MDKKSPDILLDLGIPLNPSNVVSAVELEDFPVSTTESQSLVLDLGLDPVSSTVLSESNQGYKFSLDDMIFDNFGGDKSTLSQEELLELEDVEGSFVLDDLQLSDPDIIFTENGEFLQETALVSQSRTTALTEVGQVLDTVTEFALKLQEFSEVIRPIIENDRHAKNEASKALVKYYDTHNTIFPSISFNVLGEQNTTRSVIIGLITKGYPVITMIQDLKNLFSKESVTDAQGRPFTISGSTEIKVVEFLNNFKTYYDSEFKTTNTNSKRVNETLIGIESYVKRTEKMIELIPEETPTSDEACFANYIVLDTKTFMCGGCGVESEYDDTFLKSYILNTDSEENFLSIVPGFELCKECGAINMIPSAIFEYVSNKLKSDFLAEKSNIREVKDKYKSLNSTFKVSRYGFPIESLIEACKGRANNYFRISGNVEEIVFSQEKVFDFDYIKAKEDYLLRMKNYKAIVKEERNGIGCFTDDNSLKDNVLTSFRSDFVKIISTGLGAEYVDLKNKAINSLIFFMEDFIHFVSNPFTSMINYAENLIGLVSDDYSLDVQDQYSQVISNLKAKRDYLSFVPISFSIPNHNKFEQYSSDDEMRLLLDYCSDNMILYHFRKELIQMCVVGTKHPFAHNKVKLKDVLLNFGNLDSTLKRFESNFPFEGISSLRFMSRHFLSKEIFQTKLQDYTTIFKYFCNKDLYSLVKEVANTDFEDLSILKRELSQFDSEVNSKSRLEFCYGDLFPNEDFSQYNDIQIDTPYRLKVLENETFGEYIKRIKMQKTGVLDAEYIVGSQWFNSNIVCYFDILSKFLIKNVELEDIILLDVLKHAACYSLTDFVSLFGITESIARFYLATTPDFNFPEIDPEFELAKLVLLAFPYKDDTIRILMSESEDLEDSDNIIIRSLLTEHRDSIIEEFKSSPIFIQDLLTGKFNVEFEEVRNVDIRNISE